MDTMRQKLENFAEIDFTQLVTHALLDQFEFSAHSFESIEGPYKWNGLGIDFTTDMPEDKILEQARDLNAKKVIFAHTHPLSNDDSLQFRSNKIDPREEIAFGYRRLPIGNPPSIGDVKYFAHLYERFGSYTFNTVGAVFSASGIWEFSFSDLSKYNAELFAKHYNEFIYPKSSTVDSIFPQLKIRSAFPSYFMELEKPKVHSSQYLVLTKYNRNKILKTNPTSYVDNIKKAFNKFGLDIFIILTKNSALICAILCSQQLENGK